jgi:O-acetyl-ADP-ribose deacetylase (regulator of RNase III)
VDNVHITMGDITGACVDAIVNAANSGMLGGSGVDGAIHRAAGPDLLAACKAVQAVNGVRCPTGEARITTAGRLAARYVIHTVGPVYASDPQPARLLDAAYRSSLQLALAHGCRTVALPAISCGIYGYPLDEAADIALAASVDPEFHLLDITFYLFGQDVFNTFITAHHRHTT